MRNVIKRVPQAFMKNGTYLMFAAALLLVTGCAEDEVADGRVLNTIALPVDFALELQCPDVGLVDEFCILDDPANPYARAALSNENKFTLAENSPSAKSDFYLWGTAQARDPSGENQYYTALSLHKLYSQGGSVDARAQAKRAYRSVLDNYFEAVTFSELRPDGTQDTYPLKDIVGGLVYAPSGILLQLFEGQPDAVANLDQWGYVYDVNSAILSKKP